jgi:hypothetical protein
MLYGGKQATMGENGYHVSQQSSQSSSPLSTFFHNFYLTSQPQFAVFDTIHHPYHNFLCPSSTVDNVATLPTSITRTLPT